MMKARTIVKTGMIVIALMAITLVAADLSEQSVITDSPKQLSNRQTTSSMKIAEAIASLENQNTTSGILDPDFFEISIEATYSRAGGFGNETILVELLEILEPVTMTRGGREAFTDGTFATETFSFTFFGVWDLKGSLIFNDEPGIIYTGASYYATHTTLKFGLTEDTGDGVYWRAITGELPGASVIPGEGLSVAVGSSLCMNFSGYVNNDLEVNYEVDYGESQFNVFYQTLSQTECSYPYPAFTFVSHYGNYWTKYDVAGTSYSVALSLFSGSNEAITPEN